MDEGRYRDAEEALWASLGIRTTEHRLALPSVGTEVRLVEAGSGAPVLLLHGEGTSGACWGPLVALLGDFRCLVLDRPGSGLSAPLAAPLADAAAVARYADELAVEVLDALDVDRAHLVASSFGGHLALRTAAAHPDRVQRIALFGWTPGVTPASMPIGRRLRSTALASRLLRETSPNERSVHEAYEQLGLGHALRTGRISQEELDWQLALLRDTGTEHADERQAPTAARSLRGTDDGLRLPDDLLARVRAPVSWHWGDADPFGGPTVAARAGARLPDATLIRWPHTGHAPWIEDPEHAASAVRRFLTP